MLKILFILGTRPEVIKMAPVIKGLARYPGQFESIVCVTGQHRELLEQMLGYFRIVPDYDLNLMQENQSLTSLTARILAALEPVINETVPDWILVQGDTTTVFAASLVAYYYNIKVGHVEAGLRTNNKRSPFPEEINRRLTSVIADLHFAPTQQARENLLGEGIADSGIVVTGNTVIDSLLWMREEVKQRAPDSREMKMIASMSQTKRMILVTAHRREHFEGDLKQICLALRDIVETNPDVFIVYPVHLNPNVQITVHEILDKSENILLIDPQPYPTFVWLMEQSHLIMTDSGGVQEEAPSLGKPVLVLRNTTERPEGIAVHNALLVGTDRAAIVSTACDLLSNPLKYVEMTSSSNPYGDGKAASRIINALLNHGG
jgi:UDP-N-acetylglucosamine 2-epimerase (non-hydrolysing)